MRCAALLLGLLLAGCMGPPAPAPLPNDFTITQPAAAASTVEASYAIHAAGRTHLNATLVWGTPGNRFDLSVEPTGTGTEQSNPVGTVAHLEMDLAPGDYGLKVSGSPVAADTWHLEAHFTRA